MTLIDAVASALASRDTHVLRDRFETQLRDLLNARQVELREGPPMPKPPASALSLAITVGDLTLGTIDAYFDEGGWAFDEWDGQIIAAARQGGALIRTTDRAQGGCVTGGPSVSRADGAAPIVGSSTAIRRVRARIERV